MLNQYLIEKIAAEETIAPLNIIREHLEMEVLFYLNQTPLSDNIIFYGGTALRLAHRGPRYSEDLDFIFKKQAPSDKNNLQKALKLVVESNDGVTIEEIVNKRNTLFGLLHINNFLLKHPIRLKIEINKSKNNIESENVVLTSSASNKEIIFPTVTAKALIKLKEKAIQQRNMPRDWFDYWYICAKTNATPKLSKKAFPFSKNEFSRELKRWLPKNKWKIIDTTIKFYEN